MFDVIVVGASVSGCTAATLFGQAGLRVALLEKHYDVKTPKGLCGHFLLGGGMEVMDRIGLADALREAGAGAGKVAFVADHGAFADPAGVVPPFTSARRSLIDPMLRRSAASVEGVELKLGAAVTEVIVEAGRVVGVRTREGEYRATLVVAADGHRSKTSALANVPEKNLPNQRAFLYGYYRDVNGVSRDRATIWAVGDSWGVVAPTDDGLTQLVAMPPKQMLPRSADELPGYLESFVRDLPGGPDLVAAERVGKLVVSRDYGLVRRHPVPKPGLALIGDAALTSDPTPATGCTWAMWSGAWLADATAEALRTRSGLNAALRNYRRAHRRIEREFRFIAAEARTGRTSPVQRLIWRAAAKDPHIAHKALLVGMQQRPVTSLLRPGVLARAMVVSRRTAPFEA